MSCKGLSLLSGGLDSQLAVKILERAGAAVECVMFTSPFFKDDGTGDRAVAALGVKLHKIDFTDDILELVTNPAHGFGGAMNPCIDCHARMIKRAGELMTKLGYDFVATGEVQGQRPMSQNRQSLGVVARTSGLVGRLVRPLSAKLLDPTIPETEGKLDREQLLDISGRSRDRQIALAKELGIVDYPSPAGGCRLTEEGFGRRLRDLMDHEGIANRLYVQLLALGRRFRLPDGSAVILGRNGIENQTLSEASAKLPGSVILTSQKVGPTALIPVLRSESDRNLAQSIVEAYVKGTTDADRAPFKPYQIF